MWGTERIFRALTLFLELCSISAYFGGRVKHPSAGMYHREIMRVHNRLTIEDKVVEEAVEPSHRSGRVVNEHDRAGYTNSSGL
ncbi:hypothetical protein B0J14DRAFT_601265 [Halenospora varia]|nr:hypothetical protein B0J14DRAFT_601265 [Halenospora varia]